MCFIAVMRLCIAVETSGRDMRAGAEAGVEMYVGCAYAYVCAFAVYGVMGGLTRAGEPRLGVELELAYWATGEVE